jgi:hypothetical protein
MLYEKFNEKDISLIDSFLNHHMANPYSEIHEKVAPLSERLAEWDKAKSEYLYRLLGDNFIIEKPVEYSEASSVLAQRIAVAMSYGGKMNRFCKIYQNWRSEDNLGFPFWSDQYAILNCLTTCECLSHGTLGEHRYAAQYLPCNIEFGEGRKIKLEATTKPMRALGKIVKMFNLDEEAFEEFRLEHSRILNTKAIKGTLCLSIHPLDYMTMSTNCERWTSCMNWTEPGGYRGGTIEVMNSPMVVVAYLKSNDNEYSWNIDKKWNSKKWRILCVVHPDAILSIKAYPYHHQELTTTALEWLRDLATENLGWHMGEVVKVPSCSSFEYQDTHTWYNIDLKEGRMMYCDWGSDTHYGCLDLNAEFEDNTERTPANLYLDYCGPMTCMCCGATKQDYYDEGYVVCEDCCTYGDEEDCWYCESCGERMSSDDIYWVGDCPYCCDCIDEVADQCAICGDYFYYDEMETVYLANINDAPDTSSDKSIHVSVDFCISNMWNSRLPSWATKLKHPRFDEEENIWYFNRSDLTNSALRDWYSEQV